MKAALETTEAELTKAKDEKAKAVEDAVAAQTKVESDGVKAEAAAKEEATKLTVEVEKVAASAAAEKTKETAGKLTEVASDSGTVKGKAQSLKETLKGIIMQFDSGISELKTMNSVGK